jgi:hypothetical protein
VFGQQPAPSRSRALLGAALVLLDEGATAEELAARFAEAGATVSPASTASLLDGLASLGLAAVAVAGLAGVGV